jgi:hypothetical protein
VKWEETTDDKPQDVNVQKIGTDSQFPSPGAGTKRGLGTNFTHVKESETEKDDK